MTEPGVELSRLNGWVYECECLCLGRNYDNMQTSFTKAVVFGSVPQRRNIGSEDRHQEALGEHKSQTKGKKARPR